MDRAPRSKPNPWQALFQEASAAQALPVEPHVVDDDSTLDRWQSGALATDEHEQIVAHLSDCHYCREVLAAMIADDAFSPSAPLAVPDCQTVGRAAPDVRASIPWPRWAAGALAIAASVAIIVALWPGGSDIDRQLTQVEQQLQSGQAGAAWKQLEGFLSDDPSAADQSRAKILFEQAGYDLAREDLAAGDFTGTTEISRRVEQLADMSPRLLNLRLQAERGNTTELALAQAGAMTDYGYALDGNGYGKSALPIMDATTDRLRREFQSAVDAFPADLSLRLNFGQFLLKGNRAEEARQQFAKAMELDSNNILAHIGLGLALFELEQFDEAQQHFQQAVAEDPNSFQANLNLAICLEKQEPPQEASEYWSRAERLAPSDEWKRKLRERQP